MTRMVFEFGAGQAQGEGFSRSVLGGKGAGLARMTALGVPVPPGFTIRTDVCALYPKEGFSDSLREEVAAALAQMGELTGKRFGDVQNPLLISIRSGAPVSMPGMMDTVLNLGLNDDTVEGLIAQTGDARFAYDCYRRFIAMYGEVVMGVSAASETENSPFHDLLERCKLDRGVRKDTDLDDKDLKQLVSAYRAEILARTGQPFPDQPMTQLWGAIGAVFLSWNNPRAQIYRKIRSIPDSPGTAVNVQAMVFGNLGETSATGVAFTRNPSTGEPGMYGEFLVNAQGEDVVAGVRTPRVLQELNQVLPDAYRELVALGERLEAHYRDMQDMEFTVENNTLWVLQTRTGKRTGVAMVRIAVDLVDEGHLEPQEAVRRIEPAKLDELLHPTIDPEAKLTLLAQGLPASPGAAIGRVVFTATQAEEWVEQGHSVILVRMETSPEDIHGMKVASGVLTARGGMTSHAAVVARGLGISCVTGCSSLQVDASNGVLTVGTHCIHKGDYITLEGATGKIYVGKAALIPARPTEQMDRLMGWVDQYRRMRIRTNADTPEDAKTARAFGAEGIGLCRTEHMFFAPQRLRRMRQMIMATDVCERQQALDHILPMQRDDFAQLFRIMQGLPVTIRLLDPPLHEFLPHTKEEMEQTARDLKQPFSIVEQTVQHLTETNPMLGHRGCRLAIRHPEVYEMQARAIAQAVVVCSSEGIEVCPEVMVPFVSIAEELRIVRQQVCRVLDEEFSAANVSCAYLVGTMIELPRACLVGGEIAKHADFFSFGTNDLTQTTFGFSRDDAGQWLPEYLDQKLLPQDPFVRLDRSGVGELVRIGVGKGREEKTKLKVGICGEHGGDPESVEFCHAIGFDYVSCSPFRIPIARVAAAQAALQGES